MISVENVGVEFSTKPLFSNASFVINGRDKIALVGKNGAGKSTLLKILSGQKPPTIGVVSKSADTSVGYLPQVMKLADDTTLIEETRKAFALVEEKRQKLIQIEKQLNSRTDYDSKAYTELVEIFTNLQDYISMIGGDRCDAEIERTLTGLGFLREEFSRPTRELSGGWRMRVELAKILLQRPDFLLLDEPTNHLDIESINWLENFIKKSSCGLVVVSHDKAFINSVTNRTVEISAGKVFDYKVKYEEFTRLRAERYQQQLRAYENQQKEIADTKAFIEKFRYKATKAVQVQSRIKQLEKIEPIVIDEIDNSKIRLKFPPCQRSGDFPLVCENLECSYSEHKVFSNVNLTLKRGEKVALVGKNGAGKTTFVKCLIGEKDYKGTLRIGHNATIGYFAQNQAQLLDEAMTVRDTIDNVATGEIRTQINNLLGAFMFGGEASDKKVALLSGGERTRLAMIQLLLKPVNFLVLDEPTNHLDMASKEVLKDAIDKFDGTVIVVSHDRDFLDGIVDKVVEFSNGKVVEHIGGVYDFLRTKEITSLRELEVNSKSNNTSDKSINSPNDNQLTYKRQKELKKEKNKLEQKIKSIEATIENNEIRLKELNNMLMEEENASNMTLVNEYTLLNDENNNLTDEWEEMMTKLENLQT